MEPVGGLSQDDRVFCRAAALERSAHLESKPLSSSCMDGPLSARTFWRFSKLRAWNPPIGARFVFSLPPRWDLLFGCCRDAKARSSSANGRKYFAWMRRGAAAPDDDGIAREMSECKRRTTRLEPGAIHLRKSHLPRSPSRIVALRLLSLASSSRSPRCPSGTWCGPSRCSCRAKSMRRGWISPRASTAASGTFRWNADRTLPPAPFWCGSTIRKRWPSSNRR